METLGIITLIIVMLYLTVVAWFFIFHGNYEFSPSPLWKSIVVIILIVLLWTAIGVLIQNV